MTPERIAVARGYLLLDRLAELEGQPHDRTRFVGLALQHGMSEAEIRAVVELPEAAARDQLRRTQMRVEGAA